MRRLCEPHFLSMTSFDDHRRILIEIPFDYGSALVSITSLTSESFHLKISLLQAFVI